MSLKRSIYSIVTITGRNGSSVDIRLGCASIDIYEDVLSPALSVKIQVVNSDGEEEDGGRSIAAYEELEIQGGEILQLRIEPNSATNVPIDFVTKPLFVRSVTDHIRKSGKEFYTLNLTTIEIYESETSFLVKRYPKEAKISDHVNDIISTSFGDPGEVDVDPTSNVLGFYGNQMHPYEVLIRLASKSVPEDSSGGETAGFFFYQTTEGLKFKSVDVLMKQDPKATYFYTEVPINECDFIPTSRLSSPDLKIIHFNVMKNQDLIQKLQKGTYSTQRRYFNPLSHDVTTTDFNYVGSIYAKSAENLGKAFDESKLGLVGAQILFPEVATKVLTEYIDIGSSDIGVDTEINSNPADYGAQSVMRYNTLFTQFVNVMVPLNSNLHAGDVIRCDLPKIDLVDDIDTEHITGLYLIKEVNHHFDPRGSWTTMKLIRDTFGLK